MHWKTDEATTRAATSYPLPIHSNTPTPQFGGCLTDTRIWNDRVLQPFTWKSGSIVSSPDEIVKQFSNRRYTQALALVVSWGGMGRRSKYIYGDRKPGTIEGIERILHECAETIQQTRSAERAWAMLTQSPLHWSAVMTSKTLHFLCRSLGYEENPPAVIDGLVVREKVWPAFRGSIPADQRPRDWEGNTFEAYCRYMSAVLVWSRMRQWTTTQLEATIFAQYG